MRANSVNLSSDEIFLKEAKREASKSTCERDQCGAVLVNDGKIIGKGFNSPPGNLESERRCTTDKSELHKKVTDKTCCVHAEIRAIDDAVARNGNKVAGSTLYFMRIDGEGNRTTAGDPYCTICSKHALDKGVAK